MLFTRWRSLAKRAGRRRAAAASAAAGPPARAARRALGTGWRWSAPGTRRHTCKARSRTRLCPARSSFLQIIIAQSLYVSKLALCVACADALTGVGGVAVAVVVVDVVDAGPAVAAGLRRALVDVDGAVLAGEARAAAVAAVAVQPVHAAPAVLARLRLGTHNTLVLTTEESTWLEGVFRLRFQSSYTLK